MSNYPDDMDWVAFDAANASPPDIEQDALDAAAMVELANRLGIDWQEADSALENQTTGQDEAEAAKEAVKAWNDRELLLTMAGLMIKRRAELDGVRMQAALLRKTAREVMEVVK